MNSDHLIPRSQNQVISRKSAAFPLVSIITPTYNHERYIRQCIESVLNQAYPYWEQIIVDDGSTDNTERIISSFHDERIRYFRREHSGVYKIAQTYNFALERCRGELIAILEGDDFQAPGKLAALVPAFVDSNVVLAYGITREVTEGGAPSRARLPARHFSGVFSKEVLFNNPVGSATLAMLLPDVLTFTFPCSVIIRRSALEKIGGFQEISDCPLTDYPTFLRLSLEGHFYFAPRITGFWRRHTGGTTFANFAAIRKAVYRHAKQFLHDFGDQLTLPHGYHQKFERLWKRSWARVYFAEGRGLLLERNWTDARRKFSLAAKMPVNPVYFAGGALGILASIFHLDIEKIAAILRKTHYKNHPD